MRNANASKYLPFSLCKFSQAMRTNIDIKAKLTSWGQTGSVETRTELGRDLDMT